MNEPIKIEKGVAAPERAHWGAKYPIGQMEVGDSFFAPGKTTSAINSCLAKYKRKGWKFTTAAQDGGCRVWRIAPEVQ